MVVLAATTIVLLPEAAQSTAPWSSAATMSYTRAQHASVKLADGTVLVTGGLSDTGVYPESNTAEIYDPTANTWTLTATMTAHRYSHTATLLGDGRVLVVGGVNNCATSEYYTPATGSDPATWTAVPGYQQCYQAATATRLASGLVLLAGGGQSQLFDPSTNTWSTAVSMGVAGRLGHSAVRLADGSVLVAGGRDSTSAAFASTEIYSPTTDTWSAGASMGSARRFFSLSLLPNGKVLAAGGYGGDPSAPGSYGVLATAEIYDPAAHTWTATGSMTAARYIHAAAAVAGGVLVSGGQDSSFSPVASAEFYDPTAGTWSSAGSMATGRYYATADVLTSGQVLVAGGQSSGGKEATAELYTPPPAPTYVATVEQPVNADGTSVFRARKKTVVPLTFSLTADGASTCSLPTATINIAGSSGRVTAAVNEASVPGVADTGANFRIQSCRYVYNIGTTDVPKGQQVVQIEINSQSVGSATFSIR